jgi:O-antigen ligase
MIAFYLGIFSLLNLQSKGNRPLHSITSLVVIFALGARATALFLFTALFLLYSFFSKKIKNRKRISTSGKIYVLLIASSLIFCLVINLPDLYPQVEAIVERSISRFTVLGSDNSTEERYEHYSFVMSKLNGNLNSLIFGYGTGSYGILFEGSEERIYPHNIFLELLIENGIIGFSIFLLFIAVLIVSILANRNGEFKVVLLLFILANISKSFSLVDIRFVFFIFSIMLIPKNAK